MCGKQPPNKCRKGFAYPAHTITIAERAVYTIVLGLNRFDETQVAFLRVGLLYCSRNLRGVLFHWALNELPLGPVLVLKLNICIRCSPFKVCLFKTNRTPHGWFLFVWTEAAGLLRDGDPLCSVIGFVPGNLHVTCRSHLARQQHSKSFSSPPILLSISLYR